MSNSHAPELMPLQPIFEPESLLSIPRIATKNNLLKLNWWNSPTEPLEIEAAFLASPGNTTTNCQVLPQTIPTGTMDNNNITVRSSVNNSEKSTPHSTQSYEKNAEEPQMIFSTGNCAMVDLDEDFDLKDSQLLVKGNYIFIINYRIMNNLRRVRKSFLTTIFSK